MSQIINDITLIKFNNLFILKVVNWIENFNLNKIGNIFYFN